MESVTRDNFGPLIAYLAPGATVLLGFSQFFPSLQNWFSTTPADVPTIGGFLYLTVSSIATGMTVSAIRWATLDTLHERTGLPAPAFDFSRLGDNVAGFALLIEIHYRHYLFYANMFVATAIAYVCCRIHAGGIWPLGMIDGGIWLLEAIFFYTSRDTLAKYYRRGEQLLAGQPTTEPRWMVISVDEAPVPEPQQTPAAKS